MFRLSIIMVLVLAQSSAAAVRSVSQIHLAISLSTVADAKSLSKEIDDIVVPANVKTVLIDGPQVRVEHLRLLERFTSLDSLTIDSEALSDEMIESLPQLQLTTLALHGRGVTGKSFDRLISLRKLTSLDVSRCKLSERGYQNIGQLIHLRCLFVGNTGITNDNLAAITQLTMLESLDLFDQGGSPKDDLSIDGLRSLKAFSRLELLSLPYELMNGEALVHLPPLPMLSSLVIYDATTPMIARLKEFPSLTKLRIVKSSLTEEDVQAISAIPGLKSLVFDNVKMPTNAYQKIRICRGLREFSWFSGETRPELMKALASLNLSKLRVARCALSDTELEILLSENRDLQILDIYDTAITDRSLEVIASRQSLSQLDIRECERITPKGLGALKRIKTLEYLKVNVDGMEDALREIINANPRLEVVDVGM